MKFNPVGKVRGVFIPHFKFSTPGHLISLFPPGDGKFKFFEYEPVEIQQLSRSLPRGQLTDCIYYNKEAKRGEISSLGFHRVAQRIIVVVKGHIELVAEDLAHNKLVFSLKKGSGVWIPPFILYTYGSIMPVTTIVEISNLSLEAAAHDTYGYEAFEALQRFTDL
jgi:hypothetical protein